MRNLLVKNDITTMKPNVITSVRKFPAETTEKVAHTFDITRFNRTEEDNLKLMEEPTGKDKSRKIIKDLRKSKNKTRAKR